jgi:hypothetical protein
MIINTTALLYLLVNTQFPGLESSAFCARVSLNDFRGYPTSVRSDIAATLSVNGKGNFWGLPCPLGFDPQRSRK